MTFVDTSVWIDYFLGESPQIVSEMHRLLDQDRCALAAPVRIELLSGVRRDQESLLKRVLSALPTYDPSSEVWSQMEQWVESARTEGHRFGFADLLIAAIVAENHGALWSLDQPFGRMEELSFLRRHKLGA